MKFREIQVPRQHQFVPNSRVNLRNLSTTRTRHPALKTRASRSASLNPGCNAARRRGSRILLEHGGRGRTARTVNLGPIRPDAFSPPYPLLFEATMPRLNAHSDARDGHATSSDIRTRHPALGPRVYASACTILRGNAMRRGSAIRKGQKFLEEGFR